MWLHSYKLLFTLAASLLLPHCVEMNEGEVADLQNSWQEQVDHELKVLGARNWIIIAEPSFSSLSAKGAKTIVTDETSPEVLSHVLNTMESYSYTNPVIYTPLELAYVGEDYSPGAKNLRKKLKNILLGRNTQEAQHETLRRLVLDAAKNYNVLIIKTTTAIPFSNIYMELDSGYWSSAEETELRKMIEEKKAPKKAEKQEEPSAPVSSDTKESPDTEKGENSSSSSPNDFNIANFSSDLAV